MKKTLLLAGLISVAVSAFAEEPAYLWNKMYDTQRGDNMSRVAVSTDNNIIVYGNFGSRDADEPFTFGDKVIAYGAPTNSNSDNLNMLLTKLDSNGNLVWTVSSNVGDFDTSNSSNMVATADGGALLLLKARSNNVTPYNAPVLVDAAGAKVELADWNTSCWIYQQVLVKVSGDGMIEWAKVALMDQLPVPDATGNAAKATTNGVTPYALAVDGAGNIYVGGNFRAPMVLIGDDYSTRVLTPRSLDGYNGDVQTAAGGSYLVKFDAKGNYLQHLKTQGNDSRDQITDIAIDGDNLYFIGNLKCGDGQSLTVGDKTIAPASTFDVMMVGGLSTADFSTKFLTYAKIFANKSNKAVLQLKGLKVIDGDIYAFGALNGGLGSETASSAQIASTGTALEGFVAKYTSAGVLEGAAISGISIGAYMDVFKYKNSLYCYGYQMNASMGAFIDEYPVGSWTREGRYSLASGVAAIAFGGAFNSDNATFYGLSRGNGTFKFIGGETAPKTTGFGSALVAVTVDKNASTVSAVGAESLKVSAADHAIRATGNGELEIVNTLGVVVYKASVNGSAAIAATPGVYLANGQKILVK